MCPTCARFDCSRTICRIRCAVGLSMQVLPIIDGGGRAILPAAAFSGGLPRPAALSDLPQRLIEILLNVCNVFNPDRDSHVFRLHSGRRLLLFR